MPLPTGTVTFLFTDIEGSTKLWEQHPEAMRDALARHNALLYQAVADNDGVVFKTIGDAFCAAFGTASQALSAALIAQQELHAEPWSTQAMVRVRMALHTGTADALDGDYFGQPLNRVARLLSTGHGGQTLISQTAYGLTRDTLPAQCSLQDLGAHSLRDLARPEQVYQLCHPDLPSDFPPLKSLDSLPNNLPVQLTSFVGRENELVRIKELLSKTHLLTLTGSGGCGKTRLSLQTAADVLEIFPDGVWLVELAFITDPTLVPQTVANVLGIKEQTGKTYIQTLTDHLKVKTLLLILDNCEHVLTACAGLADILLRNCPNLKVLASSREGLGIAGETVYRIPSLSLPDPKQKATPESLSQYEAVQLFLDRATAALPSFTITNQNAPSLASVCHRVDGIPLAIELAAARVRSLSVEEINARLDNLFRLLTGGSKTALPRQQTLRALIDWSYGLLTKLEKRLLCRLSVFSGGWTLIAAEAVCSSEDIEDWEVLDLLTSLVDKSLVQAETVDGQTRYRFLETARQYARDRLAESDENVEVRGRHRDHFLQMAEEIKPKLNGPEHGQWLSVLETEHDNLRQAITFCLDETDGGEKGLRLGAALQQFWETRGHLSEARVWLTALLLHPQAQTRTKPRADVLNGAGNLAQMQGDYAAAQSRYQESLTLQRELDNKQGSAVSLGNLGLVAVQQGDNAAAWSLYQESLAIQRQLGDKNGIATSLNNLGGVAYYQGDYTVARELLKESLTLRRELGDRGGIANALDNLANLTSNQGNYGVARSLYEESLAIYRELGDRGGSGYSLNGLGYLARMQEDYAAARAFLEESLAINRELGNRGSSGYSLLYLGLVAVGQGDYAAARTLFEESLTLRRELGDRSSIADSLKEFAFLAAWEGSAEGAARLFGAAEALRESLGAPMEPSEREEYDKGVAAARETLGEDLFASAWATGWAMTWEQAAEYALGEAIPPREIGRAP